MKYLDEYRDQTAAHNLAAEIRKATTRPWTIMEICGGQTNAIVRYGIDELLPREITLLHGPGCPVCVTPIESIDKAIQLALRPDVIFCSFGDMLRVPGSSRDLLSAKAAGGDVRMVYSPLDAVKIASENPDKKIVFFAIGFETTAPANAMAVIQARKRQISNFFLLVSQVLVPPAIEAIIDSPDNRVQAFLAAGHVCAVMGYDEYESIAASRKAPIVVTGFEPVDILQGLHMAILQLERGEHKVENQYRRAVRREGNRQAIDLIREVFETSSRTWRGIGEIPKSGLRLKPAYKIYDAETVFDLEKLVGVESAECISGLILQGAKKPPDCPAFGKRCVPERPLGATMVSSEGACAAYYRYRRNLIFNRN
jgi:hydrogenase expression/formation protein HypD